MSLIAEQCALLLLLTVSASPSGFVKASEPFVYVPVEGNFKLLQIKNEKSRGLPTSSVPVATNIERDFQNLEEFLPGNRRQYPPYGRPYYLRRYKKPKKKDEEEDQGKGFKFMKGLFDDYGGGNDEDGTRYRIVRIKKRRPYRPKPPKHNYPHPLYSHKKPHDSYSPSHYSYDNSYNNKYKPYHPPHSYKSIPQTYGDSHNYESKPQTYDDPYNHKSKPQTYDDSHNYESKPQTYDDPYNHKSKPQTYDDPHNYKSKPQTYDDPYNHKSKPQTYDYPHKYESKPQTYDDPYNHNSKPQTYDDPYNHKSKPQTYDYPYNHKSKPQTYDYPHKYKSKAQTYDHPHHSQYDQPHGYDNHYGSAPDHYHHDHYGHDHKHHFKQEPHHVDHHHEHDHKHHLKKGHKHQDHHEHNHKPHFKKGHKHHDHDHHDHDHHDHGHHDHGHHDHGHHEHDHHGHDHHGHDHHGHDHHGNDHHGHDHGHDHHEHDHKHHHKSQENDFSSIFKDSTHLKLPHGIHQKSAEKHHSFPDVINSASFRHPPPLHKAVHNTHIHKGFQVVKPETVHFSHEHSAEKSSGTIIHSSAIFSGHADNQQSKSFHTMTNEEKLVEFLRQNKIEVQTSPPLPNVISPLDVLQSPAFKVNLPLEDESTEISLITPYVTTTTPKPTPKPTPLPTPASTPKPLPKLAPTPIPFTSVAKPDYLNNDWVPSVHFSQHQAPERLQPYTERSITVYATTTEYIRQNTAQRDYEEQSNFVPQLISGIETPAAPVIFRQSTKIDLRPPSSKSNHVSENSNRHRFPAGRSRAPSKQTFSRFRPSSSRVKTRGKESRKKPREHASTLQSSLYLDLKNLPDQASWSVEEPYLQELEPIDEIKILGGVKFEDKYDGLPIGIQDLRKIIEAFSSSQTEESDYKNWNEWISHHHPELIPYLTMKSIIQQDASVGGLISQLANQKSIRSPFQNEKLFSSSSTRKEIEQPALPSLQFQRDSIVPKQQQRVRSTDFPSRQRNSVQQALANHRARLPPSSSTTKQSPLPKEQRKPVDQGQQTKSSSEDDVVKIFGQDSVLGALELVMEAVEETDSGEKLYLVRSSNDKKKEKPRTTRHSHGSVISPPRTSQVSFTMQPAIQFDLKNLGIKEEPLISYTPYLF
ncbi:hypothetical protein FHG87_008510 [Trinorchestia longiramus]|nr:hypothetical protein FHG87_008510 [Trinorchestia longiramus]